MTKIAAVLAAFVWISFATPAFAADQPKQASPGASTNTEGGAKAAGSDKSAAEKSAGSRAGKKNEPKPEEQKPAPKKG